MKVAAAKLPDEVYEVLQANRGKNTVSAYIRNLILADNKRAANERNELLQILENNNIALKLILKKLEEREAAAPPDVSDELVEELVILKQLLLIIGSSSALGVKTQIEKFNK